MKTFKQLLLPGFIIWLVPFVIAFFFYDRSGQLTIDKDLFKSIMIVISSIIGATAIVRYNRTVTTKYARAGVLAGIVWLVINLLLDLLILIPMSGMGYQEYFTSIGLRYLQIPVFTYMAGVVLDFKLTSKF